MLSGVGPVEHLRSHKIPIVFEHPQIGKNLVDHPVVDLYFKDKRNSSVKWMKPRSFDDLVKLITAMVQYFVLGSGGPLATNVSINHPLDGLPSDQRKKFGESAAFIRSDDPKLFPSSEYPQHLTDSTSAADSPDLELFTTPFAYKVWMYVSPKYWKHPNQFSRNMVLSCLISIPLGSIVTSSGAFGTTSTIQTRRLTLLQQAIEHWRCSSQIKWPLAATQH